MVPLLPPSAETESFQLSSCAGVGTCSAEPQGKASSPHLYPHFLILYGKVHADLNLTFPNNTTEYTFYTAGSHKARR